MVPASNQPVEAPETAPSPIAWTVTSCWSVSYFQVRVRFSVTSGMEAVVPSPWAKTDPSALRVASQPVARRRVPAASEIEAGAVAERLPPRATYATELAAGEKPSPLRPAGDVATEAETCEESR